MKQLTARSMEEGAWGLVTRFGSGGPQHPDEVLELAKVVASYGGNYTSHHGSEGYEQEKEIDFAIRVAGARPGTVMFGRGYKPGTPVSDGSQ